MARDRILLEKIPALTFYAGEETVARRTDPIPQLTCIGKPCKIYQPEVVRCTNIGGTGTEVEWKVRWEQDGTSEADTDRVYYSVRRICRRL